MECEMKEMLWESVCLGFFKNLFPVKRFVGGYVLFLKISIKVDLSV